MQKSQLKGHDLEVESAYSRDAEGQQTRARRSNDTDRLDVEVFMHLSVRDKRIPKTPLALGRCLKYAQSPCWHNNGRSASIRPENGSFISMHSHPRELDMSYDSRALCYMIE